MDLVCVAGKMVEKNAWKRSFSTCSCLASSYYFIHIVKWQVLCRFNQEMAAVTRRDENHLPIKTGSTEQFFLLFLVVFIGSFKGLVRFQTKL